MSAKGIVGLLASTIIWVGCGDNISVGTPAATVTPVAGLRTTEAGGQATFAVALEGQPRQDVLIELSSSDPGEGTISPSTLTFTRDNYDAPQAITITGVQDDVADGAQPYTIVLAPAASMDARFDGLDLEDVRVENVDDDSAGVTVTPRGGLTTTEAGGTAALTVVLNSRPTASVAIALASSDLGEGTVSPASLTFTPTNWNAPQTVTVTGVDDALADGAQGYRIVTAPATSGDPGYAGLDADDVAVSNNDNDSAGIAVAPVTSVTTETGGQATFTVVLGAQPSANVTVPISSMDPSEGTTDVTSLTFTPANWNAPQIVTVTGVDDALADGNQVYTVATGPAASADPGYAGLDAGDVPLTNTDNDSAGVTLSKLSGLATTEGGGADTFTVVLSSQPTASVAIALASSDLGEGRVSPASLSFTPTNWNAPQIVTVTGVDDPVADGDQPYRIVTAPAVSADAGYSGLDAADASATNIDNDSAGFIVTPTSGLTTTEAGGQATFTIVLTSQPAADVAIPLGSSDGGEGTVSPAGLTFTPANWNAPQTVTVTGVNDFVADGNQIYSIVTSPATSADAAYQGRDAADVAATNLDNDSAGIIVTPVAGLQTGENGGTATFTIVLASEPGAPVTIGVSSTDTTEGAAAPTSVTFTTLNWNAPQTVTVTGVDDAMADGNQVYRIATAAAASADPAYAGLDAADVSVTNVDNDSAGVRVTPTSGLATTESGGTATFEVVLESQPAANVTIPLASSDLGEGTVSPASLTFTPASWNAPQTVTATGVDDLAADGNQPYAIRLAPAISADPGYALLDPADVAVANVDNDTAGVLVNPTGGLTTTEAGGAAFFTIVLTAQPLASVTIALSSSNPNEGTLPIATLTFTPADWNLPQTVNVIGANDAISDGNQPYTIVTSATSSTDPAFDNLPVADVAATNIDDDIPGFTVDPVGGLLTSEFGDFDTFTIVLNTAPTADVTIGLSINDTTEATLGGVTGVTFTPLSWNVPQTITVTGLDDALADGTQPFLVVTAPAVSADPSYSGLNPPDIDGTNFDNDTPGVYVKARRLLRTGENGSSAFFRVSLTTQPTSSVTCTFSSSDPTEGTVSPTTLTFTPTNYATQQNVTVRGVDDAILDGDQLYTVISAPCTSADATYNLINPRDVSVLNRDNE